MKQNTPSDHKKNTETLKPVQRKRNSITLTAEARQWLIEQMELKRQRPSDVVATLFGKLSAKTIYEIFNPNSKKTRFDRKGLFLVAEAVGIKQSVFLKVIGALVEHPSDRSASLVKTDLSAWGRLLKRSQLNVILRETEVAMVIEWDGQPAHRVEFCLDTYSDLTSIIPETIKTKILKGELCGVYGGEGYELWLERITGKSSNPKLYDWQLQFTLIQRDVCYDLRNSLRRGFPDEEYLKTEKIRTEHLKRLYTISNAGRKTPFIASHFNVQLAVISADDKLVVRRESYSNSGGNNRQWDKPVVTWNNHRNRPLLPFAIENCSSQISKEAFFNTSKYGKIDLANCKYHGIAIDREALSLNLIAVYHSGKTAQDICKTFVPNYDREGDDAETAPFRRQFNSSEEEAYFVALKPAELGKCIDEFDPVSRLAAAFALISTSDSPQMKRDLLFELELKRHPNKGKD